MALPPLRTVQDVGAAPSATTPPPAGAITNTGPNGEFLAGPPAAPLVARIILGEVLQSDLISAKGIEEFVAAVGPRIRELFDRDRVSAALVQHGFLTHFQLERVQSGNTFGMVFGNYRVQERLGGGNFGIVFRAQHRYLNRTAAIKVIPINRATPMQFLERFNTEMHLLAGLDDPNVVRIFDTGTLRPTGPGQSPLRYAILEYVDGCDLEKYVDQHGVAPVPMAAAWGRQLAAGLAAAHARNLVHRDFKPSNVLISKDRRAKVSDLGLARHFASIDTPRPGVVGSVEFMAPEQVADACTVGPAADVYALGVTLFWAVTGQMPIAKQKSSRDTVQQIRSGTPRRLREINPNLPAKLEEMLARMMDRDPGKRPTALEACGWLGTFAAASVHPALDEKMPAPETLNENELLRFAVGHFEQAITVREEMLCEASAAVLTALGRVAQFRGESPGLQKRLQEYVKVLAERLKKKNDWLMLADPQTLDDIIRAIPIRNIGLTGVPDHILNATGPLSDADQTALERHTLIGCNILDVVVARHGRALSFARTARDIIRSHHERWDGTGFPDHFNSTQIPPGARLVAVAEAYDALRQPHEPEPGFPHQEAIDGLIGESQKFFDPAVIDAMVATHENFAEIFATIPD